MLGDTPGDIALTSYAGWRVLWEARFASPLDDAESFTSDADGRLRDIGRRATSLDEIGGQFMGLVKFSPRGFAAAEQHVNSLGAVAARLDMTSLLRSLVEHNFPVQVRAVDGFWYEVDNRQDAELFPDWAAKKQWANLGLNISEI